MLMTAYLAVFSKRHRKIERKHYTLPNIQRTTYNGRCPFLTLSSFSCLPIRSHSIQLLGTNSRAHRFTSDRFVFGYAK